MRRPRKALLIFAAVAASFVAGAATFEASAAPATSRPADVAGAATAARSAPATTNEYPGPFVMMKVPAVCAFPQADLRYYNDNAPAGTTFLRTGAHGHGHHLQCIYVATNGTPADLVGDHPYGKWLVFTANHGIGLLIPQTGVEIHYLDCSRPGYHFPFPAGNGQPNDCGESWLAGTDELAPYLYQDDTAGDLGQPMFPAVLP